MPVNMSGLPKRGTSTSKSVDNASQRSYGSQTGTINPKEALDKKWNEKEINPSTNSDK